MIHIIIMYNCKVCNYITKIKGNFTKHLLTKKHLNNIKEDFVCNKCNKQLSTKR